MSIAFKGFANDLTCKSNDNPKLQCKVGETYKEEAHLSYFPGLLACEYPLKEFYRYPPNASRYCILEVRDGESEDPKYTGRKLKILREADYNEIVEASLEYIKKHGTTKDGSAKDEYSIAVNENPLTIVINKGDEGSVVASTGSHSAALNPDGKFGRGRNGAVVSTGWESIADTEGLESTALVTGINSIARTRDEFSTAVAAGDESVAISTREFSTALSTGYKCAAIVSERGSVAIDVGLNGRAKGGIGCFLVLAERGGDCEIKNLKSVRVDGDIIKADTFYTLVDGEFVEAEGENGYSARETGYKSEALF